MAKQLPTISAHQSSTGSAEAPPAAGPRDGTLAERVGRIVEMIRPAVQADGGDVELVEITADNRVRIRLHGACVGCPSASVTLQLGIERNLREYAPEITGVEAVE